MTEEKRVADGRQETEEKSAGGGRTVEEKRVADIEKKRRREKETVGSMIEIYCHGVHKTKRGTLCDACKKLRDYADLRTEKCPFMETKTFCSACKVHCYSKEMQNEIRQVMRYAGPRMLFVHPVLALGHMKVTLENKRKARRGTEGLS
ncbi:MAG: nitrous oxide-stimulated promoter family protein [Roseburia sp.]|nr:nitrous oxide-stimulated promoter family protein [Roseburia sp.]